MGRSARVGCLVGLLVAAACGREAAPPPTATAQDVRFATADGVTIEGSLYTTSLSRPPGLVLLPGMGSDRSHWAPFAEGAQQAGMMCLAITMRGNEPSGTGNPAVPSYRQFNREDWLGVLNDIDAALGVLRERGADPDNLALVGASIGANLALEYAVGHPDVQAVVMVSPGLDYKEITTRPEIAAFGKRPVLLVTSKEDSYSASSCVTLKAAASGFCELRQYKGAAHGTDIFTASNHAIEQVLLWLKMILKPQQDPQPSQGETTGG